MERRDGCEGEERPPTEVSVGDREGLREDGSPQSAQTFRGHL